MGGSRVALVASDRSWGAEIEAQLREPGRPAPVLETFQGIRELLGHDTDGLLVIAVREPAELPTVKHLLQDVNLQKFPVVAVLLDGMPQDFLLAGLERYAARRLRWPADAGLLRGLLRETGRGQPFTPAVDESLE